MWVRIHNKKRFLAAGVAIPPYSGTTKIKPSDLSKLSDIEFQGFPQISLPFFFSGDQSGRADSAKSRKKGTNSEFMFNRLFFRKVATFFDWELGLWLAEIIEILQIDEMVDYKNHKITNILIIGTWLHRI